MKFVPHYTIFDKVCLSFDQVLRTLTDHPKTSGARYPGYAEDSVMSDEQRKHSAGLMRINHAGEVCAQALYHGQAFVSRESHVEENLNQAAIEEGDHLVWCRQRLDELGSHTSYLNFLWYVGSFCIGVAAGVIGDEWSLGFVVETERQVIKHLEKHLALLADQDLRSYQILSQMEQDEAKHRDQAIVAGARELPGIIKKGMSVVSKIMVKTAYWI